MSFFNYRKEIANLPADWKTTEGAGVKIALIDTGADLSHPNLQHLDIPGRKFDASKRSFDPETELGEDDITDSTAFSNYHGTQLLSILAGKSSDNSGVNGLVPEAEIYIIKLTTDNNQTKQSNLLRALKLCKKLDVDIISNANAPMKTPSSLPLVDEAIEQLAAQKILFISHLKNTKILKRLNKPPFPSDYDHALAIGVAQKKLLKALPDPPEFSEHVRFLLPELNIKTLSGPDHANGLTRKTRSSHSTAIFTGLCALWLAKEKQTNPLSERKTKDEFVAALQGISPDFSKDDMLTGDKLKFFKI